MSEFLNLASWPRRNHFEFFRDYELPWFSVCVSLEVGPLRAAAREVGASFFTAYHYAATRAANETPEFRYRLRGRDAVLVHSRVDCGTTYLVDDERFAFVYFPWAPAFANFDRGAQQELVRLRSADGALAARDDRDDLIHCSTVPWFAFTSITHARRLARPDDAVPKLVFGKCEPRGEGLVMPVAVEVHHAVMDGVHVARYLERLQHLFADRDTLA